MAIQQGFVRATLALLAAAALGGCADTALDRADENGAYEGLPPTRYYGYGYGYVEAPPYLVYPEYYEVLYPLYASYYDPWLYPDFYYGVTWFPRAWFGIGYAGPFVAYSPYRFAPWDDYYLWRRFDRRTPRFGSAANEAERLARMTLPQQPPMGGRERDPGGVPLESIRARDAAWREAALRENAARGRAEPRTISSPMAREREIERSGWIAPAPGSSAPGPAASELSRLEPAGGVTEPREAPAGPRARDAGGAATQPALVPRMVSPRADAAASAPSVREAGPAARELQSLNGPPPERSVPVYAAPREAAAPASAAAPDASRFAPRAAGMPAAPAVREAPAGPRGEPVARESSRERSEGRESRDRERER